MRATGQMLLFNTYSFTGLEIIAIDRVSGMEHSPGVYGGEPLIYQTISFLTTLKALLTAYMLLHHCHKRQEL